MRRVSTAAWVWGFTAYSYLATTLAAAWFIRRAYAVNVPTSLLWQGAIYAAWLPMAGLVWAGLSAFRSVPGRVAALAAVGVVAVPLESLVATALDIAFRGGGLERLGEGTLNRLPVSILLYTAMTAVGVAAVLHRRAAQAWAQAEELNALLAHARETLARTVATPKAASEPLPERLMVAAGTRRLPVLVSEVECFEAAGNYVVVHWGAREGLIRNTLQGLEARLDPAVFARSHRSALVNLARVREAQPLSDGSWRLVMQSGAERVVSRTFRDALLTRLGR